MTLNLSSMGEIKAVDKTVLRWTKRWLNLHPSTTNGIFYTVKQRGGLGIPKLSVEIPIARVECLRKMTEHEDNVIRQIAFQAGAVEETLRWCEEINQPPPAAGVKYKPDYRRREEAAYQGMTVMGPGAKTWCTETSNTWAFNTKILGEGRYTRAIQLRTNTYPVRATLKRGRPGMDESCRRCDYPKEMLGHVISACPGIKEARIRRHNQNVSMLARDASDRGWRVFREPRVLNNQGRAFKPDVAFVREGRAIMVDPTVKFEHGEDTLADGTNKR